VTIAPHDVDLFVISAAPAGAQASAARCGRGIKGANA
jgi:hypothetical protein